jgi:hypothetical protein
MSRVEMPECCLDVKEMPRVQAEGRLPDACIPTQIGPRT